MSNPTTLAGADDLLEMVVSLDGKVIPPERWAELADTDKPIEIRGATVWREGFGRKPFRMSAATADMVAASAAQRPILFHHDPTAEEGVVHSAQMSGQAGKRVMLAALSLDGDKARQSIARGVSPRFSIHPQPLEGGSFACSECAKDWLLAGPCLHPLLGRAQLLADGPWEMGEISRTPLAAVPGTGLAAALSEWGFDRFIPQVEAMMADQTALAATVKGSWEGRIQDEEAAPPAESAPAAPPAAQAMSDNAALRAMQAQLAELQAQRAADQTQLATLRAEYERQQDQAITEAILTGARSGKLHKLANTEDPADPKSGLNQERALAKAMGLDAYRAHLDRIPSNPALAAGIKTPAPGQSPGEVEQMAGPQALADRILALAKEHPTATTDQLARMAHDSLTAEGRIVTLH